MEGKDAAPHFKFRLTTPQACSEVSYMHETSATRFTEQPQLISSVSSHLCINIASQHTSDLKHKDRPLSGRLTIPTHFGSKNKASMFGKHFQTLFTTVTVTKM